MRFSMHGWTVLGLAMVLGGCVEQTLTVESDPPGALVYLNNQEVGRTPMTRDFTWYGDYDVQLRLEGYETLKTHRKIEPPLWNTAPLDLLANLVPWNCADRQTLRLQLTPLDKSKEQPAGLMARSAELRGRLEGSEFTKQPATKPATAPATRP